MRKNRAFSWLDEHFEEALLVLLLIIIFFVSLVQVVIRNLPFIPALKWAEEFCRFAWIWSVFLSLPYTVKMGSMLRVTLLLDLAGAKARRVIDLAADLITAGTMAFLCAYSVPVIRKIYLSAELSPAMAWPMWAVYSVIFAGFFLGALRGVERFIRRLREPDSAARAGRPDGMAGE